MWLFSLMTYATVHLLLAVLCYQGWRLLGGGRRLLLLYGYEKKKHINMYINKSNAVLKLYFPL